MNNDFDTEGHPPHPLDYISRDQVQDLWGIGYTITPRRRHPDPFHVPPEMVPQGRSYQWMHLIHDKKQYLYEGSGWAPVPNSRHEGLFMPFGTSGAIEVNGLGLFEKPKFEVDADRASQVAAAHKQVDDWKAKWGGQFAGEVTVGQQTELGKLDTVQTTKIGSTKTIEDTTAIPRDMVPYIAQIFEERDLLAKEFTQDSEGAGPSTAQMAAIDAKLFQALSANPDAPKWPTLNGILLPIAIDIVRKRITEEAASGQAS